MHVLALPSTILWMSDVNDAHGLLALPLTTKTIIINKTQDVTVCDSLFLTSICVTSTYTQALGESVYSYMFVAENLIYALHSKLCERPKFSSINILWFCPDIFPRNLWPFTRPVLLPGYVRGTVTATSWLITVLMMMCTNSLYASWCCFTSAALICISMYIRSFRKLSTFIEFLHDLNVR